MYYGIMVDSYVITLKVLNTTVFELLTIFIKKRYNGNHSFWSGRIRSPIPIIPFIKFLLTLPKIFWSCLAFLWAVCKKKVCELLKVVYNETEFETIVILIVINKFSIIGIILEELVAISVSRRRRRVLLTRAIWRASNVALLNTRKFTRSPANCFTMTMRREIKFGDVTVNDCCSLLQSTSTFRITRTLFEYLPT